MMDTEKVWKPIVLVLVPHQGRLTMMATFTDPGTYEDSLSKLSDLREIMERLGAWVFRCWFQDITTGEVELVYREDRE